ncbi:MAG: esterase/lipase family protein [Gammaproteobacteria bacterium]
MIKKQCANNFKWYLTLFSGKNWTMNDAMNSQRHQDYSLMMKTLGVLLFVAFFNMAVAINSPVKAADTLPPANIDCLFNWAQTFHPDLFSPAVSGVQFSSPYIYRYYPVTNSYVGFSSADNHVYYLGPYDVAPQDVGPLSTWLAESGCGARTYPVIFIHGIASSADTWTAYRDYLINNAGWTFGGIPTYDQINKTVNISCPLDPSQAASCTANSGDFYTLNFPDSQFFPFDIQGGGLAAIIKAVLDANPGKTKVILVSHSMGGLAAREYLQGLARFLDSVTPMPYREDVAKLITVGTPHQGSFWAEECHNQLFDIFNISGNVGICDLLPLDIDPNSIAVEDLKPNSSALNVLNDLISHPLPANISYVSIIGTGQATLVSSTRTEEGDGIVSAISQDLVRIAQTLPQQKSVRLNIPFREDCGNQIDASFIGSLGETHTCETTDINVGAEVLRDLQ